MLHNFNAPFTAISYNGPSLYYDSHNTEFWKTIEFNQFLKIKSTIIGSQSRPEIDLFYTPVFLRLFWPQFKVVMNLLILIYNMIPIVNRIFYTLLHGAIVGVI